MLELVRVAQVDGAPERNRRCTTASRACSPTDAARRRRARPRLAFLSELAVAAYLGILINWVTLPDYPLRERLPRSPTCRGVAGQALH